MRVRAIRGAITVSENTREAILSATRELLTGLIEGNGLEPDELISANFTMTPDLNAVFPAEAAREMGWNHVPLLCMSEIGVPGALPRCVRVMVHTYTAREANQIKHLYLREAVRLRPDLTSPQ
ncbi:MAG TPA: chorismate mutase [Stenomitos sp.]